MSISGCNCGRSWKVEMAGQADMFRYASLYRRIPDFLSASLTLLNIHNVQRAIPVLLRTAGVWANVYENMKNC